MADVVIIRGKAVDRQLAEQLWDAQRELKVLRAENHRLQQQLRDAYARIPSVTAWDEHAAAQRVAMNESKALRERLRRRSFH